MMVSLLLILTAVVVGVTGQLSLKMGMNHVGTIDATSIAHPVETMSKVFRSPMIWLGLALYGCSNDETRHVKFCGRFD